MATTRQKEAARRNIAKAREVQSQRAHGARIPRQSAGLSTAQKDRLPTPEFAFPKERKEPLTDARHVRSAIARFDQVEGVTDAQRDQAWKRIRKAANHFHVEMSESDWREEFQRSSSKTPPKQAPKRTASRRPARTSAGAATARSRY